MEHVRPALAFATSGSPRARLREHAVRLATFLASADGKVVARLIAGIHESEVLRKLFRDRVFLPRRAMAQELVEQAVRQGELPKDTDPVAVLDALYGPQFLRLFIGHAPLTEEFARAVAKLVLGAERAKAPSGA